MRAAALASMLCVPLWCAAQPLPQAVAAHAAASAPRVDAAASGAAAATAAVGELRVVEDDAVRIEELRERGQTRRIVVRSKLGGVKPYEILPADGGRDLSQDRRATGQRVWRLLSF